MLMWLMHRRPIPEKDGGENHHTRPTPNTKVCTVDAVRTFVRFEMQLHSRIRREHHISKTVVSRVSHELPDLEDANSRHQYMKKHLLTKESSLNNKYNGLFSRRNPSNAFSGANRAHLHPVPPLDSAFVAMCQRSTKTEKSHPTARQHSDLLHLSLT